MIHGIFSLYAERWPFFQELILQHIKIASTAILISGSIGLFLGILISEHRRFATWIIGVINVAYTIPSISMLGFLIPFTGIGNKTATIALTIYGLLPMAATPIPASPPLRRPPSRWQRAWEAHPGRFFIRSSCLWRSRSSWQDSAVWWS